MASKKVSKKTAKKLGKKPAEVVQLLPFNKANAKLFADNIFSDKQGRVSFLKLCDGELSNGKDGGRTLHCALGEAYFTFVDPHVAKFVSSVTKKFGESTDDNQYLNSEDVSEENLFNPKYSDPKPNITHIPTLAVVDALVEVAQLRSKNIGAKKALGEALLATMEVNDDACSADITDDLQRSEAVARTWREQVVPLLK
jgi:hypothetical protein